MADTDLLDYAGLKHYDSKIKACMWNWQKTKKNALVQFKPVPESDLEPVVDFMFTETPPAEGEKGPENPSTIAGVSSIGLVRASKNAFYLNSLPSSQAGVTISVDDEGVITLNGTVSGTIDARNWVFSTTPAIVRPRFSGQYLFMKVEVISGILTTTGTKDFVYVEMPELNIATGVTNYRHTYSNVNGDTVYPLTSIQTLGRPSFSIYGGQTFTNYKFRVMFEVSDSNAMSAYEPAHTTFTTIALGDTYYGGSLNVATGVMTVTWGGVELDGTESWINYRALSNNNSLYRGQIDVFHDKKGQYGAGYCTHFAITPGLGNEFFQNPCVYVTHDLCAGSFVIITDKSTASSLNEWLAEQKAAGHPVVYVWETNPYTVQLTPQQIKSLPALDKYEPRINTVYTDREAVQVGYQRYADDPAPLWYVKDMLRANIEALTSGRNTVVRDKRGNPHIMVVVPKFRLSDIDSNWAAAVHPAFIVDGVEKSEILIGKYLASQDASGKVQTLPHQAPWTQVNFDNALAACRELGPNFCLNTNAMWSARVLWDYKRLGGSHVYLGNTNYGRDYTYHELTGTLKSGTYLPGDTSLTDAATFTGTGGPLWNDDGTESGIADLVGNVWEWVGGFRLNNGEIQIIPNNDASLADCDMTAASTEWKAILEDGALVAPETADTLKFDSAYADASGNVGAPSLNTSITNLISTGYNNVNFKSFTAASGITVPVLLKQLAIFPVGNDLQGALFSRNSGERLACRGGYWTYGLGAGPFALHMNYPRTYAFRSIGFRAGFVS